MLSVPFKNGNMIRVLFRLIVGEGYQERCTGLFTKTLGG
jgi:hypothetical protein